MPWLIVAACILTAIAFAILFEIARDWWGARTRLKHAQRGGRTHARRNW